MVSGEPETGGCFQSAVDGSEISGEQLLHPPTVWRALACGEANRPQKTRMKVKRARR